MFIVYMNEIVWQICFAYFYSCIVTFLDIYIKNINACSKTLTCIKIFYNNYCNNLLAKPKNFRNYNPYKFKQYKLIT